jgi:hypothetical protein
LAVTPQADEVALLRSGQVDVLVVSRRMAGVTPALLGAAKISPNSYVLLTLKAGEPARQSFSEIGGPVQICDCPGPANPDLTRLPFHYVPSKRRMAAGSTRGETNAAHRGDAGTYSPMPRNAGAVGAATGAVASDFLAHSLAEKNSADQSQDRHEDRRANAQQKRTDTLGSQRRQIGV